MDSIKNIKTVGLIVAMEKEIDFAALFDGAIYSCETKLNQVFHVYTLKKLQVIVVISGVGEISASIATTLLATFKPDCIINFGVVGGLRKTSALVIIEKIVHYDFDLTTFGNALGQYDGFDSCYVNSSDCLNKAFMSCIAVPCQLATVASGDKFIADSAKKDYLKDCFDADVCDMESAGIGYACHKLDIPFTMLKLVSDQADSCACENYNEFFKYGSLLYINAVKAFVALLQAE